MQGIDEPFETCNTLNIATRFIRPVSHVFALVFCLYYIGYRRKLYNYLSFWFSVYHIIGTIAAIFEIFQCSVIYKDESKWSISDKIVTACSTTITTCMMSLWWIIILVCWYEKWTKDKIIKIAKSISVIIIIVVLPVQLTILFIFGLSTLLSNILRLISGIVGFILQIAIIFVLKSDENVAKFTSCQLWFVLVFCGPVSYFVGSAAILTFGYVWGRILIYQYFWLSAFWIFYLESIPQTKIYDWDHEWNQESKRLQLAEIASQIQTTPNCVRQTHIHNTK